jgi:mannose-1-phosphate guanylyltransferase
VNWLVVLAGGRGERFWPLSRTARPKQFLRLLGPRTLLEETADRVAPLIGRDRTVVVTGRAYAGLVEEQLPGSLVLAEPVGRNTAASIAWAAHEIRRRDPDAVMAVLPSDHAVADVEGFRTALKTALHAAGETGRMTLLGVRPTRPETGYGYIEAASVPDPPTVVDVRAFVEKPNAARAAAMVAAGGYYWNAGMFILPVPVVWAALERHLPATCAALVGDAAGWASRFASLDPVSFDVGVMEKSRDLQVLPMDVGWDDVGSFEAVARILADRAPERVVWERVSDVVVIGDDGPWIAGIGLSHLVVVRTPDAVLLLPPEEAQSVRELVRRLAASEEGVALT